MSSKSNLVQVSIRLPEDLHVYLRRLARREAVLQDTDVSCADLIRDAVFEAYPVPSESEEQDLTVVEQ